MLNFAKHKTHTVAYPTLNSSIIEHIAELIRKLETLENPRHLYSDVMKLKCKTNASVI